jgi:uncharacterized membrane protein SpoIIM required for sporulation
MVCWSTCVSKCDQTTRRRRLHLNLDVFVEQRRTRWNELDALLARAGRRAESLGPDGVRRLGALYRASAADLALARRRFAGDPVVARLETLVTRARPLVYDKARRGGSLAEFATTAYWRRVRERPGLLLAAALLLFGPWVLAAVWAVRDPGAASGVVPSEYRSVTEPRERDTDLGLTADQQAAFSSEVFTNNIRVTLLAFAGGIAAGLGTAVLLVYQGVLFGAITGLSIWAGNGGFFFELVSAHGVLELSCVVVASAAGLRMGWALVSPGHRRRGVALAAEARVAVEIVLGTAPWLVLAGLVEGFLTPRGLGLGAAIGIGVALGAAYWALVLWRGRPPRDDGHADGEARFLLNVAMRRPDTHVVATAAPAPSP